MALARSRGESLTESPGQAGERLVTHREACRDASDTVRPRAPLKSQSCSELSQRSVIRLTAAVGAAGLIVTTDRLSGDMGFCRSRTDRGGGSIFVRLSFSC